MATDLGPIGVGLTLLFCAFLIILAIQLYYLFLHPRTNHLTPDHCHSSVWSSSSSSNSSGIHSSESRLNNHFWWQKIKRDKSVEESEEDCEGGPQYVSPLSGESPPSIPNPDEDILQTLQGLVGPPRLLFTITEETLEDLVENNDDVEISDRKSGKIPEACCDLSENITAKNPNLDMVLEESISSSAFFSSLSASAPSDRPNQLGHCSLSALFENSPSLPGRGSLLRFHHCRIHPLDDHNCVEVQSSSGGL